jgi:hypothetical protein
VTVQQFMQPGIAQDRIVRKEVALGLIREMVPPQEHVGLQFAPWMEVATDDVIFDYLPAGQADGLAPARAEDAESELAQKDDLAGGQGRASVIDWAIKDHYVASDVMRYRDYLTVVEAIQQAGTVPPSTAFVMPGQQFAAKVAKDTARRRRRLDNRIEWLIMQALSTGLITYNDGKIKFAVDFGRPANQQAQAPASGTYASTTHDPIGDVMRVQDFMWSTYSVRMTRALCSRRFLNSIVNSALFAQRVGLVVPNAAGTGSTMGNPNYLLDGWGPLAAIDLVQRQTGITFIQYDSVYRTRPIGSKVVTNNRFFPDNRVLFLPEEADIAEFDDTDLGFGKTLTSPHPAGLWSPGFYEWEREYGVDPWGYDIGTGVKAFPVFPHMDLTYTWDVTLP